MIKNVSDQLGLLPLANKAQFSGCKSVKLNFKMKKCWLIWGGGGGKGRKKRVMVYARMRYRDVISSRVASGRERGIKGRSKASQEQLSRPQTVRVAPALSITSIACYLSPHLHLSFNKMPPSSEQEQQE